MKIIFAALLVVFVCGCSSPHTRPKYTALIYEKTVPHELAILESQRTKSVSFAGVSLGRVCATLSSYDIDPKEFQNSAIIYSAIPGFGDRVVNLKTDGLTLAELYDRVCEHTDSIWWVDYHIHIAPNEPLK